MADEVTEQMAQDLAAIRRQNEIAQLDREWEFRRETLLVRSRGGATIPTAGGALVGSAFTIVFGTLCMVVTGTAGRPAFEVLIGLAIVILGIVLGVVRADKAGRYREAEKSYLRQRNTLLRSDRQPPSQYSPLK